MVRTRSMTVVPRDQNPIKAKAAAPKRKAAAARLKRKAAAHLKMEAASSSSEEERKRMAAAASAVDVEKILRLKKEALEAIETKCFPLTAKARLAAAGAGQTQQPCGAEMEKVPEKKKKKVVTYLVSQGYIDYLKAGLFQGVDEIPEERLAKKSQLFRDGYHAKVLLGQKLRACQQVLLDQYHTFGYAYDAKEVTDDEVEGQGEVKN